MRMPPPPRDALFATVRVDARERDGDIAVLVRELGDLLVRDLAARVLAGIDGEDDECHLELAVHLGHLGHRLVLRLVAEVAAHRLLRFGELVVHRERGFPRVRVDVDGDQVVQVHAVMTLGDPAYSSCTSAARRFSTARWLIEPLSVISPASSDGGSSMTRRRVMRFELPVAGMLFSFNSNSRRACPPVEKTNAPSSPLPSPAITTSRTSGAKCSMSCARSG